MGWSVRKRKRRKNGKSKPDKYYTLYYKLPGMLSEKPYPLGVADKQVAKKKGEEVYKRLERIADGLEDDENVKPLKLLELLPKYLKEKESDELNGQYMSDLKSRNKRLVKDCSWVHPHDIKGTDFTSWRTAIGDKLSAKSKNDYFDALDGFCEWMQIQGILDEMPLKRVRKLSVKGKQKVRDCYTVDEIDRLLTVAGKRKVLYMVAILTSYRRGVLYKLQWCHIDLDSDMPVIRVPASIEKNASENPKFVRDDVKQLLLELRGESYNPTDRVFEGILPKWDLVFLENDLAKIGLSRKRPDGKFLDFHSFRHTACTLACQTGMGQKDVQSFMNHKTSSMVEHYNHMQNVTSQTLIEKLPRFDKSIQSGTGIGTENTVKTGPKMSQTDLSENGTDSENPLKTNKKTALTVSQSGSLKVIPTGFEPVFPG
tara:strand:+ start:1348 stop:2628 length:1281 start_codon:yes stop_codon:yes gene_type:complete